MLLHIIILIIGFIILIKGADFFVDGASSIARHLKVSKMLVGLTIVSFGTSAPELAVSIKSLISGSGDIVLGNVIGTNIINVFLILGIAAMFNPLSVKSATVKKELPITILITSLFIVLLSDNLFDANMTNAFTRSDGIVVLLFFMVFVYYLISIARNRTDLETDDEILPVFKSILFRKTFFWIFK